MLTPEHPIAQAAMDVAMQSEDAGHPIFSTAVVILVRAACLPVGDFVLRALVNSAACMVDAVQAASEATGKKS
jgi:hypothetical protein